MTRRALVWIHKYAGLVVGVVVVFVGLTGSTVVYRPEIERLLNPEWFRVVPGGTTQPLETLVAKAVETYPGGGPTFVSVQPPLAAGEPVFVMMKRRFGEGSGPWIRAHLDPYSGEVLVSNAPEETLPGILLQLHAHLLAGEHSWGEQVVGVFGVALLLFCVTGFVIWWPGLKRFHRGFAVRTGSGRPILYYDLHRVAGIVFLVPLMLVSMTGIVLVFPKYTRQPVVNAFGIERPARAPKPTVSGPRLPVDAVRSIVERTHPQGRIIGIQLPGNRGVYQVRVLQPGDTKVRYGGGAKLVVWIDPASGEILKTHDARAMPVASRVMFQWIFPTHTGDIAGEAGRFVMFVAGLLPLGLFVTGIYVWYRGRTRRRSTAARYGRRRDLHPAP